MSKYNEEIHYVILIFQKINDTLGYLLGYVRKKTIRYVIKYFIDDNCAISITIDFPFFYQKIVMEKSQNCFFFHSNSFAF